MAIKRIIIHAGMHKTGTTSIQNTLYFYPNRKKMAENGFAYFPGWGENHGSILRNLFSPKPLVEAVPNLKMQSSEEDILARNHQHMQEILSFADSTHCETLIFSGENTVLLGKKGVDNLKDFFERYFPDAKTQIVLFVRSPLTMQVSLYQQRLNYTLGKKIRNAQTNKDIHIYQKRIEKFLSAFGEDCLVYPFEEAVSDVQGIVGYFLKKIGYPEHPIDDLEMKRSNEARCWEVVEFLESLWDREPFSIEKNGKRMINPSRQDGDLLHLYQIRGVKFDLPYEYKIKFYALAQDDIAWLKEATGIDYTGLKIERQEPQELYQSQTIEDFIQVFDKLTDTLQAHFLDFFAEKYKETGEEKFKALFAEGSIPWKVYHLASVGEYAGTKDISSNKRVMFDGSRITWSDNLQVFIKAAQQIKTGEGQLWGRWYPDSEDRLRVSLRFGAEQDIRGIRIDPSLYSSLVCVETLLVNGTAYDLDLLRGNYDDRVGNTFVFYLDDPQFYINSGEPITSLEAEFIVDTGSFTYARYATLKIAELMEERKIKQEDD